MTDENQGRPIVPGAPFHFYECKDGKNRFSNK
jgi:hypothetical protein